jgi:hypothetical protein
VICDRLVGGFLRIPPPIKTDRNDITEILLKVALNTKTLTTHPHISKSVPFEQHSTSYNLNRPNIVIPFKIILNSFNLYPR